MRTFFIFICLFALACARQAAPPQEARHRRPVQHLCPVPITEVLVDTLYLPLLIPCTHGDAPPAPTGGVVWDWGEKMLLNTTDTITFFETICEAYTDTFFLTDTIFIETHPDASNDRPHKTSKGWLFAAAFVFLFLMAFFSKKKKHETN